MRRKPKDQQISAASGPTRHRVAFSGAFGLAGAAAFVALSAVPEHASAQTVYPPVSVIFATTTTSAPTTTTTTSIATTTTVASSTTTTRPTVTTTSRLVGTGGTPATNPDGSVKVGADANDRTTSRPTTTRRRRSGVRGVVEEAAAAGDVAVLGENGDVSLTGSNVVPIVGAGFGAMLAGAALVLTARRRRRQNAS